MAPKFYYEYQPLQGENDIRLLKVDEHGGVWSRQPCFTLIHVPLDSAPPFETISYAWGNPGRFYRLPIKGCDDIAITKSVSEALPFLTQKSETKLLWLDQICINQDDRRERGHQVALMGKIYTAAERTIVWLGLEDRNTKRLTNIMEHVSSMLEWDSDEGKVMDNILTDASALESPLDRIAIEKTIGRAWFSRAWVIQEYLLSKDVVFLISKQEIDFKCLAGISWIMNFMTEKFGRNTKHREPRRRVCDLYYFRDEFQTSERMIHDPCLNMLQIIWTYSAAGFEASDPRDLIFAYLGLWKPPGFDPNYNLNIAEAYIGFARQLVGHTSSLDYLAACRGPIPSSLQHSEDFPTWAPDWTMLRPERPLMVPILDLIAFTDKASWCASRNRPHGQNLRYITSSRLEVCGKVVDTLCNLSATLQPLRDDEGLKAIIERMTEAEASIGVSNLVFLELIAKMGDAGGGTSFAPEEYEEFLSVELGQRNTQNQTPDRKRGELSEVATFFILFMNGLEGRKMAKTENARLGFCPQLSRPGDRIAVLHGSSVPFLLRETKEQGTYKLVGDCFIDGIMLGEAVTWEEDEADEFVLI